MIKQVLNACLKITFGLIFLLNNVQATTDSFQPCISGCILSEASCSSLCTLKNSTRNSADNESDEGCYEECKDTSNDCRYECTQQEIPAMPDSSKQESNVQWCEQLCIVTEAACSSKCLFVDGELGEECHKKCTNESKLCKYACM